jgi:hypothetical protein
MVLVPVVTRDALLVEVCVALRLDAWFPGSAPDGGATPDLASDAALAALAGAPTAFCCGLAPVVLEVAIELATIFIPFCWLVGVGGS